jgi:nicotinate phosphoribosyltransferase
LPEAKIMLSGDLDEYAIRDLVSSGAPVDAFGVGTQLATSADAPAMGTIYKLVELDVGCGIKRFTAKLSPDKTTLPGAKQLFRFEGHDVSWRAPANAATARRCCVRCCWAGNWSSRCRI